MNSAVIFPDSFTLKAYLPRTSVSTLRQLCDDVSDTALIQNNGIAPDWGCNRFLSDSIVFNENRIASFIAALTLTLSVNGA